MMISDSIKISAWLMLIFFIGADVSAQDIDRPEIMLAERYSADTADSVTEYWVSEKYDGVRAVWNGSELITRGGNVIRTPEWFTRKFPPVPLDGELWAGRQRFSWLSGIVRRDHPEDDNWRHIRYMVFDMPSGELTFDQRLQVLGNLIAAQDIPWLVAVPQWKEQSEESLEKSLKSAVAAGAEGLMLHRGSSLYRSGRNKDLLKVKVTDDSEAIVLKHIPGKGRLKGMTGALEVRWKENGRIFRIGSGLTDNDRAHPPPEGAEITFRYNGLTSKGLPRFPRYWRIRRSY